jgi:hypothetical protein
MMNCVSFHIALLILISLLPSLGWAKDVNSESVTSKLTLEINYPKTTCKKPEVLALIQNRFRKSCPLIGKKFLVGKGPWGFGIFDQFSCGEDKDNKELQKYEQGTWQLQIRLSSTYVYFTLFQYVKNSTSTKLRPEVSLYFLQSPHTLKLLEDEKFISLIVAELLDEMPMQAFTPGATGVFPRLEPSLAPLQKHSLPENWEKTKLDFDPESEVWQPYEGQKADAYHPSFKEREWMVNIKERGSLKNAIRSIRDQHLQKLIEGFEELSINESEKGAVKSRKLDLLQLGCLTQRQLPLEKNAQAIILTKNADTKKPSLYSKRFFSLLGGGAPKIPGTNSRSIGKVLIRSSPLVDSALLVEGSLLNTKYDLNLKSSGEPDSSSGEPLDFLSMNLSRIRLSIGLGVKQPIGLFTVFVQVYWSYLRQSLTWNASTTEFGFKDRIESLWDIFGARAGLEYFAKEWSMRVTGHVDARLAGASAMRTVGGNVEWDYVVGQFLPVFFGPPREFRTLVQLGAENIQFTVVSENIEVEELRLNARVPAAWIALGFWISW